MSDVILRAFLGWLLALIGIWHPYVVSVNAKTAAALAATTGFVGGMVVALD